MAKISGLSIRNNNPINTAFKLQLRRERGRKEGEREKMDDG